MQEMNTYWLIQMGLAIRLLRQVDSSFTVQVVIETADTLRNDLEGVGFNISLQGLISLDNVLVPLRALQNKNVAITNEQVTALTTVMTQIEHTVFSEALTKNVYLVSHERFSLNVLMKEPDKMFADGIYANLSDLAKYDFSEGFKCLVFSRPTACAFHLLRGTEAVLKDLYLSIVKRQRTKVQTWANLSNGLSGKKNIPDTLITQLDHVRNTFRNPTQHPEIMYNNQQASDLIATCVGLVNEMQAIIVRRI